MGARLTFVELDRANEPITASLRGLRIAVLSHFLPRFDTSAADERVHRIVRIMLGFGARVTCFHWGTTEQDAKYEAALPGASFRLVPRDPDATAAAVVGEGLDVLWATMLWSPGLLDTSAHVGRRVKECVPGAAVVLDTMDFHAKKFRRKHEVFGNAKDQALAEKFLQAENACYPAADHVVVVTDVERCALDAEVGWPCSIHVLPTIHQVTARVVPFEERQHLAFLGNFEVDHNADAARHFMNRILPQISARRPDIEFHLVGHASQALAAEGGRSVTALGFVSDVEATLARYRVFVCPITYGAGMKGKLGAAAGAGLPFVTSTIGAEGFPVVDGVHCFIADEPDEFARKCLQLYEDPDTWSLFSLRAREMIAERVSVAAASRALLEILAPHCAKSSPGLTMGATVAALVPSYSSEEWLGDCLTALIEQTRPPDAIIVVDDGSGRPPIDVVRRFAQVTLLATPQKVGLCRLLTEIVRRTNYDAYLLHSGDDWSSGERLKALLAEAERTGAEVIVSHEIHVHRDRAEPVRLVDPLLLNATSAGRPWQDLLLRAASLVSRDLAVRFERLQDASQPHALRAVRVATVPGHYYFRRMSADAAAAFDPGAVSRSAAQVVLIPITGPGLREAAPLSTASVSSAQ